MLTRGETRQGSCREDRAAAEYRLDGRSSSKRWLGARMNESWDRNGSGG
jgi:hypothetical protein